jgi:putative tryptophan/tyrosine transport system permease protein
MSGEIMIHILLQGSIYSLVVMGVYLSSRVVQFDDLTTEGSFGIGGALSAVTVLSGGPLWMALCFSWLGGLLSGAATGILHTKLRMNHLICGLVVTTALFSVCLKLTGANVVLNQNSSILNHANPLVPLSFAVGLAAVVYLAVRTLLKSEVGLVLKAAGSNPQMALALGKSVDGYKILGLAAANSLTAFAGALFVQWNGFFSITGNIGTLVIGLTGLILGEMIRPSFGWNLILGAFLYQALFAAVIELQMEPLWNNLIKAVLIVLLIQLKPRKNLISKWAR